MVSLLKSKLAFSLVELAITTAVLGALATLTIAVFQQYQYKTRVTEMDLTYINIRTSSFSVMQDMSPNISNASCLWQYDPHGGEQSIVCHSVNGKNLIAEIMNIRNSRLVILSNFSMIGVSSDWIHTTTIFHCDIDDGINNINYTNTSYDYSENIRSTEDPTTYATQCATA